MYGSRSGLAPTRSTATEMPHHDLDPRPRGGEVQNPPGTGSKRRNRPSAPDPPGGEKFVNITYSCGDYECTGQIKFPYSRLRRFSKRARRELRSVGAACKPRGTIRWEVECQHWQQDILLDKIFDWFRTLPNTEPSDDFVNRGDHPGIDSENEWVSGLTWRDLLLIDHTFDYLHLREPLDNKRPRQLIWKSLALSELRVNPLTAEDVHLAWHLLQFLSGWNRESAGADDQASPAQAELRSRGPNRHASGSSAFSERSIAYTLEEEFAEVFKSWTDKNGALMRNMIRKVTAYLEFMGIDAFDHFIAKLEVLGEREDNGDLVRLFKKMFDDRNSRAAMRSVSSGSTDSSSVKVTGGMEP